MTHGPFLKVDINGYLPGEEIKINGDLIMNIEVLANNRIQILINDVQEKTLNFTRQSHPKLFVNYPTQFKHEFPLILQKDAQVIPIATRNSVINQLK